MSSDVRRILELAAPQSSAAQSDRGQQRKQVVTQYKKLPSDPFGRMKPTFREVQPPGADEPQKAFLEYSNLGPEELYIQLDNIRRVSGRLQPIPVPQVLYYRRCISLVSFQGYGLFCRCIDAVFKHFLNFTQAADGLGVCVFALLGEFLLYAEIVLKNVKKLTTTDPFEATRTLQALEAFRQSITEEKIEEAAAKHYRELQQIDTELLAAVMGASKEGEAAPQGKPVARPRLSQYFPHMSETGAWAPPEAQNPLPEQFKQGFAAAFQELKCQHSGHAELSWADESLASFSFKESELALDQNVV